MTVFDSRICWSASEISNRERKRYMDRRLGCWLLRVRPWLPPVLLVAVACAPFPVLVATALAALGCGLGWSRETLALVVPGMAGIYCARLGHELGHLVAMARNFRLVAVYGPPCFTSLWLELSDGRQPPSIGDWLRLSLGGPLANLSIAAMLAVWPGPGQSLWSTAALVGQLVLGVGNLLPVPGTDGHRSLRLWQMQRRRRQ